MLIDETLLLVTLDDLGRIHCLTDHSVAQLVLKVMSQSKDEFAYSLLNPSAVSALVKYVPELVVVGVAADSVSVVVAAPAPCIVVPIPDWHSAGFHHPYQQKPWVSCTVEYHHSMMSLAYPAQSFFVPSEAILV